MDEHKEESVLGKVDLPESIKLSITLRSRIESLALTLARYPSAPSTDSPSDADMWGVKRKLDGDIKDIHTLAQRLPDYDEFLQTALSLGVVASSKRRYNEPVDVEKNLWVATGLPMLASTASNAWQNKNCMVPYNDIRQVIEVFIDKGYGKDVHGVDAALRDALVATDLLRPWAEKFGAGEVTKLISNRAISADNFMVVFSIFPELAKHDFVQEQFGDWLCTRGEQVFKKQNQLPEPDTVSTLTPFFGLARDMGLLSKFGSGTSNLSSRLILCAALDPEWAAELVGNKLGEFTHIMPRIDTLAKQFANSPKWNNHVDVMQNWFTSAMQTVSVRERHREAARAVEDLENLKVVKALLSSPGLEEMPVTLSFWGRHSSPDEYMRGLREVLNENVRIPAYSIESLIRDANLNMDDVRFLAKHIRKRETEETTEQYPLPASIAEVAAQGNKPELLELIDPEKVDWAKIGRLNPKNILSLKDGQIEIDKNSAWKPILDGKYGERVIGGFLVGQLLAPLPRSGATNSETKAWREKEGFNPISFVSEHKNLFMRYDVNDAATTQCLLESVSGALKAHTALGLAAALKLSPDTINSKKKQRTTFSSIIASSGKIGYLQQFLKLGGKIDTEFMSGILDTGKDPIVEFALHNSDCKIAGGAILGYLKNKPSLDKLCASVLARADVGLADDGERFVPSQSKNHNLVKAVDIAHQVGIMRGLEEDRLNAYTSLGNALIGEIQPVFDEFLASVKKESSFKYGEKFRHDWAVTCVRFGADPQKVELRLVEDGFDAVLPASVLSPEIMDALMATKRANLDSKADVSRALDTSHPDVAEIDI